MSRRAVLPLIVALGVFGLGQDLKGADQSQGPQGPPGPYADRAQGPYRGLFGGAGDPNSPQTLDARVDLSASYDDNLTVGLPGVVFDPRLVVSGEYESLDGRLDYRKQARHLGFGLSGFSALRHYSQINEFSTVINAASATFGAQLARGTTFAATGDVSYYPLFGLDSLSKLGLAQSSVQAQSSFLRGAQGSFGAGGGASLTQAIGSRTTLTLDAGGQSSHFIRSEFGSVTARYAGGSLHRQLTKNLGLHLGYQDEWIRYAFGGDQPLITNQIYDIGVDYSRALSISRRTTFAFRTGTTVTERSDHKFVDLMITANLDHEFARTWHARAAFNRGNQYLLGFSGPLLSNSILGTVDGLVSPRVLFTATTGYTFADLAYSVPRNSYTSELGSVRLSYGLTRLWALYAQYALYHYRFSQALTFPFPLPVSLRRNTEQVGVSLWLPLLKEGSN